RLVVLLGDGRTLRVDPLNLRIAVRAPLPGADDEREDDCDRSDDELDSAGIEARAEWLRPTLVVARPQRDVLFTGDETRVVLVQVELALESERVGVVAQEALDVRRRRQHVEVLGLEGFQVLGADLRLLLELGKVELLPQAGFAEAIADLEHGLARL